jgi:flagellar biosynthesis protein FliR
MIHHLTFRHIARAMFQHGVALLCLVTGALALGIFIYHWAAGLSWIDAFLNASMILGGMGPVDRLPDSRAKLLAGFYALFSGLVFLVIAGAMLGPLVHALLHRFHVESPDTDHPHRAD